MRQSPVSKPRPRPPARQQRKGIAARVMEANPSASREDAFRVARAINRKERENR